MLNAKYFLFTLNVKYFLFTLTVKYFLFTINIKYFLFKLNVKYFLFSLNVKCFLFPLNVQYFLFTLNVKYFLFTLNVPTCAMGSIGIAFFFFIKIKISEINIFSIKLYSWKIESFFSIFQPSSSNKINLNVFHRIVKWRMKKMKF